MSELEFIELEEFIEVNHKADYFNIADLQQGLNYAHSGNSLKFEFRYPTSCSIADLTELKIIKWEICGLICEFYPLKRNHYI